MEFIIPQHDQGALSLWAADPEKMRAESADRMARLEALDPERLPMALAFLSGYHPRVFDAGASLPRRASPGRIRRTTSP